MLTRMRMKNFKAWADSGDIRLAPITVLFGANSAGKTSIPQLLLLMKQTAESPDRQRVLHLGDSQTRVDLGATEDVLHHRKLPGSLVFEIEWERDRDGMGTASTGHPWTAGDHLSLETWIFADARGDLSVTGISYQSSLNGSPVYGLSLDAVEGESSAGPDYRVQATDLDGAFVLDEAPSRFYELPPELVRGYPHAAVASDLALALERQLGATHHLGSDRDRFARMHPTSSVRPDGVGARGELTVQALLARGDDQFYLGEGHDDPTLLRQVETHLQQMGIAHSLRVERIHRLRPEHELFVRARPESPEVNLADAGSGIAQALPAVVAAFTLRPGSTLLLEHPDARLHPRAQAALADVFIDAIRAQQDGQPRDVQFIIESHSEHLLRRLQRRIAEGRLANNEVALHFVDSVEGHATITELDVNEFGQIANWPKDFFGDAMGEAEKQMRAILARQKQDPERGIDEWLHGHFAASARPARGED